MPFTHHLSIALVAFVDSGFQDFHNLQVPFNLTFGLHQSFSVLLFLGIGVSGQIDKYQLSMAKQ